MKKFIILIGLLFVMACSNPEERRKKAEKYGEVLYQHGENVGKLFIVKNKDRVRVIRIGIASEMIIFEICTLPVKICEHDKKGKHDER